MKSIAAENRDVMEHVAIAVARHQRDHYLAQLDQLLTSLGDEAPISLGEIRRLFTTYEPPDLPSLSAEIEAMREER
jgi:hypothetical protein